MRSTLKSHGLDGGKGSVLETGQTLAVYANGHGKTNVKLTPPKSDGAEHEFTTTSLEFIVMKRVDSSIT